MHWSRQLDSTSSSSSTKQMVTVLFGILPLPVLAVLVVVVPLLVVLVVVGVLPLLVLLVL
jgi:hypothetical protein